MINSHTEALMMKEKTENVVHSEKKDYTALLSVYTNNVYSLRLYR